MRIRDGKVVFSPSDLNVFFESPFASWMDRAHLHAPSSATPDLPRAEMALLSAMGDAHEHAYLAQLIREGHDVWQPSDAAIAARDTDADVAATIDAMRAGREILFQATLRHDGFEGKADFLRRVDTPGGAFHYEVLDTKLARKPKPYFLLQLCAYAEMLEANQGVRPRHVHVVNGDRTTLPFRTDDYFFFYLTLKRAFLEQQSRFDPAQRPTPSARANHGRWQATADSILETLDHPSRVAGITSHQIARLADGGIRTMAELATTTLDRVPHMDAVTFAKLHHQARLQVQSAGLAQPLFEILIAEAHDAARGLALLPPPSPLDVFFDMEGYPLAPGGLEYLFGSMVRDEGETKFVDFWAHDSAQERLAFEAFIDWVCERFERDSSMHVYHYAPYEVSALKRLASTYGSREEQLDVLLRAEVFVDLYRIVKQGVRVGEPRYSLKNVEHLYRGARQGDVANAGQSVVEYARWIETRDGHDHHTSAILGSIRDYNKDDCESTLQLADWLRAQQRSEKIVYVAAAGAAKDEARSNTLAQRDDEIYAALLLAKIPDDRSADPERWRIHELLAWLCVFHRREDKPFWWNIFAKQQATDDELREDTECLGGLDRTDMAPISAKRSMLYEYRFDAQETKVGPGVSYLAGKDLVKVNVEAIDLDACRLLLRVGQKAAEREPPPARMSLIPGDYVHAAKIAASIRRTAESWDKTTELRGALRTLLRREPPRIQGHAEGAPLLAHGEDLVDGTVRIIRAMRDTTLAIQGPPGAGKTTAASHAILALIRDGKRVGISSNSHKAIEKLMEDVLVLAKKNAQHVRAAKIGGPEDSAVVTEHGATHIAKIDEATADGEGEGAGAGAAQLVGGTVWALAGEQAVARFDYLFVDEAGQVSLANLVGMAPSTDNIVLLGDQMQLSQPTQASHPGQSGMSALDYFIDGATTIRPEQGIFLAKTWRLHPSLCSFISGAFYEDLLTPEVCTEKRVVRASASGIAEAGLRFVASAHEENTQCSEEEGEAIERVVKELLARKLVLEDGTTRALTAADILVVAPYNLQVRLLRRRLPALRIASVDKFQGQQAAVVILSMCASTGDDSPRGLEFLFSPNRLNVAISRAQCLAIVVGSPKLAESRVTSVKQMKLVNLYCRILLESAPA